MIILTPKDGAVAAAAYRLFMKCNNDGAPMLFGGDKLILNGHTFKSWTSLKSPVPGHKVLNVKGKGWHFSFIAAVAERYDRDAMAQFSVHAVICLESGYPVMVYGFKVDDIDALKKELVLLRMFDLIDDSPLKIKDEPEGWR